MENAMGAPFGRTDDQTDTPSGAALIGRGPTADQGFKDQALAQAHALLDEAKSTAETRARAAIMSTKDTAADCLTTVTRSLELAGQQLKARDNGMSGLVQNAAQGIGRAAQYLETANIEDVVGETEGWARRNPALFLGGAFVLGVLGARFLKSSRPTHGANTPSGSTAPKRFGDVQIPTRAIMADR